MWSKADYCHHIFAANGTLNAMLNDFTKEEKVPEESLGPDESAVSHLAFTSQ